tara:strand:+ start:179 stop:445 length:267 start_codon:yes stop_codon:yes gene_type:complete
MFKEGRMKEFAEERVQEAFKRMEIHVANMLPNYAPLEIAGVLAAHSIKIYRACLSEEEFERICETIYSTRHIVSAEEGGQVPENVTVH